MEDVLISSMLRIEYVSSEASLLNCISSEVTNYHYPVLKSYARILDGYEFRDGFEILVGVWDMVGGV
jgi:hypothetical protein